MRYLRVERGARERSQPNDVRKHLLQRTATATDCPAASAGDPGKKKEGGLGRPRRTSATYLRSSGDLVDRRVGNLVRLKLRSPLNDLSQRLQHFGISRAAVGLRVLLRLPEADRERFRSARDDEGHFVLEARLLAKQGNDFLLEGLGKLRVAVGFQLHANVSSVHLGLLEARWLLSLQDGSGRSDLVQKNPRPGQGDAPSRYVQRKPAASPMRGKRPCLTGADVRGHSNFAFFCTHTE